MNAENSKSEVPHHKEVTLSKTAAWLLFRSYGEQEAVDSIYSECSKKTVNQEVYI